MVALVSNTREKTELQRYISYAIRNIVEIGVDKHGPYALVPATRAYDAPYKVRFNESDSLNIHATCCTCVASKAKPCRHMMALNAYYAAITAPYRKVEQPAPVAEPMPAKKIEHANLRSNKGFSLLG